MDLSGGSSTGGGGGVGPAGRKSDGSYELKEMQQELVEETKVEKLQKQVVDFIKGGGVTGALLEVLQITKSKKIETKGGDVFGGEAYGYNEAAEKEILKVQKSIQTK